MAEDGRERSGASDGKLSDYALTALLMLETLILFVAAPLGGMDIRAPSLIGGVLGVPLILAIIVISSSIGARVLAGAAIALAVCGAVVRIDHPSFVTLLSGHMAVIVAVLAISLVIAKAVFAPGRITHHRIEGAVILYFNISIVFTSIYRLISQLDSGAFTGVPAHQTEAMAASSMLYFSFTTLTSTGFGEILPVNPFARSMANLESILGQLYIAILLARIVTMHRESRQN